MSLLFARPHKRLIAQNFFWTGDEMFFEKLMGKDAEETMQMQTPVEPATTSFEVFVKRLTGANDYDQLPKIAAVANKDPKFHAYLVSETDIVYGQGRAQADYQPAVRDLPEDLRARTHLFLREVHDRAREAAKRPVFSAVHDQPIYERRN